MKKSSFDLSHVKSMSAIALLYAGEYSGRIVANWSNNPNGSVCTTTVMLWSGPLSDRVGHPVKIELMGETKELYSTTKTAKAGGGGYCKFSQCIGEILNEPGLCAAGLSTCQRFFEDNGYQWIQII